MSESNAGADGHASPRSGRTRWFAVAGVAIAVVAGVLFFGSSSDEEGEAPADLRFAEVIRTDLAEESSFAGTLGRVAGEPVTAGASGTVTAAPAVGDTVSEGETLFEIDREPVVLLYGETPMYRTMRASEEDLIVAARTSGTVTWVADPGTPLVEGDVLLRINDEPVVVLYGDTPAYRTMANLPTDIEGPDVLQLEEALVHMGFDPDESITVDGVFTSATENLVEDWEESLGVDVDGALPLGSVIFIAGPTIVTVVDVEVGDVIGNGQAVLALAGEELMSGGDILQLEESLAALGYGDGIKVDGVFDQATTEAVASFQVALGVAVDGVIELGEVVFRSSAVRVSDRLTPVGGFVSNGGAVLAVAHSDIVVSLDIPAVDQNTLSAGDPVTIELPDGTLTPGLVDSVSSVATQSQNGPVFEATVILTDPSVAGDLDEAPVDVFYVSDSVDDVMAVPVTALLALREGGYAVEIARSDGTTVLVSVEPDFFADGLVEVTSDQLQVGAQVVIP